MASPIATICAAIAALIGVMLVIRLGGQFVAGHTLRIAERYRNRRGDKS